MANRQKVFISSTSKDLIPYREMVIKDVNNSNFSAVNMEGFLPDKMNALQTCYDYLKEADIFIGIYAYRYGFCPPKEMKYIKDGKEFTGDGETSITEWEYRWAMEKGIPVYLFVAETDNWDETLKDDDLTAINSFRDKISSLHTLAQFNEQPDNLAKGVIQTLLAKHHPANFIKNQNSHHIQGSRPYTFRSKGREFFDRIDKQAELQQAIDERSRVIGVYGRGGIGKTGLVSYILEGLELTADALDGLVYSSLKQNKPDNAPSVAEIVGDFNQILPSEKQIPLASTPPDQHLPLLLQRLRDKHYVLLLDNFESIQDKDTGEILASSMRELIETVLTQGGLTVVITTRHRFPLELTLSAEMKWVELPEGLPMDDAKAFMRSMEGSQHLDDEQEIERFIEYVMAIPRGLQVGMGWLNEGREKPSLSELFNDPVEQERVIEHISNKVVDALGQDLRRVLEAIAVCHEPASLALLTYLLSPYHDPSAQPLKKTIQRLITSQFIIAEDGRYTLYPFDRDYCLKTLPKTDADDAWNHIALNRRAIAYYQSQRLPQSDWRMIADLHPHLMEFEHLFALGDYDEATRVLLSVDYDYLLLWGYAKEVKDYHLRLEEKSFKLYLKLSSFNILGLVCAELGEIQEAIEYHDGILKIYRDLGDKEGEENQLSNLGNAYYRLNDVHKAIEYHEEALRIARDIGNKRGEGDILGNLGLAYADLEELPKAIEYHEEALKISRMIMDKRAEGSDLGNLGNTYRQLGELDKAMEYCEEALKISREIGNKPGEGNTLGNIAIIYRHQGKLDKAIEYCEGALKIFRAISNKQGEANELNTLGNIYAGLEELHQAIIYYEDGLKIFCEIGSKKGEGIILGNLGNVYANLGNLSKALDYFKQALEITRTIGNPQHIAHWENAIEIITQELNNGE